jgi:hypothetical protein
MNETIKNQPISNIQWVDVRTLKANDYNPNVVLTQELKLLEFSLIKTGWIQPILASNQHEIIDGFHRSWLSANSKRMIDLFGYMVPTAFLDLTEPERMLLTVRINRAKGNHVAVKMHDLIWKIHNEYGYSRKQIAEGIGASNQEIDLLLQENVFTKLNIQNHKYNKAWVPRK